MLVGARLLARSSAIHTALACALFACMAIAGCGDENPDDPPPDNNAPRGPKSAGPAALQQPPQAVIGRTAPKGPKPVDPYDKIVPMAAEALPEEAAAEEKPRDYADELLSASRGAEACVKPRLASDALPSEVAIALEGLVLESGTIVSGSARAPVLTPEELECVKRRLESTRLPSGVKDAPLRVNTTLTLKFQRQEAAAPPPGAPTAPAIGAPAAPNTY